MSKGERCGAKSRRNQVQASRCPLRQKLQRDALNFLSMPKCCKPGKLPESLVFRFFGGQSHEYAQLPISPEAAGDFRPAKLFTISLIVSVKLSGQTGYSVAQRLPYKYTVLTGYSKGWENISGASQGSVLKIFEMCRVWITQSSQINSLCLICQVSLQQSLWNSLLLIGFLSYTELVTC